MKGDDIMLCLPCVYMYLMSLHVANLPGLPLCICVLQVVNI